MTLTALQPTGERAFDNSPDAVLLPAACFPGSILFIDSPRAAHKAKDFVVTVAEIKDSMTSFATKAQPQEVIAYYEKAFRASFRPSNRSSRKCQIWGGTADLGGFIAKVSVQHWSDRHVTVFTIVEDPKGTLFKGNGKPTALPV